MALPIFALLGAALPFLTKTLPIIDKVIDRTIDDPDQAAKLKNEMAQGLINERQQLVESQAGIITAEASSEHWVVAAWRPILMLIFGAIIAFNYIIHPLLGPLFALAGYPVAPLPIPPDMWTLLTVGIGGYIGGRTIEKATKVYAEQRLRGGMEPVRSPGDPAPGGLTSLRGD